MSVLLTTLCHTTQHRAVLIIFLLKLQTITICCLAEGRGATNSVRALKEDMGRLQSHQVHPTVLQYYKMLLLLYAVHTEQHTKNTMTAIKVKWTDF